MAAVMNAIKFGVLAGAVGMASPALADKWLGSATIFGGNAQNRVLCILNNVGPAPVTLTNLQIFNNAGAPQTLALNSCGSVLGPKQTCTLGVNTQSQRIYGCKVLVNRKAIMRGVIQAFDVSGEVLQNQPLK